jgi:hypothetical protein
MFGLLLRNEGGLSIGFFFLPRERNRLDQGDDFYHPLRFSYVRHVAVSPFLISGKWKS